jgi:two-component system OmpR family sensor kinase
MDRSYQEHEAVVMSRNPRLTLARLSLRVKLIAVLGLTLVVALALAGFVATHLLHNYLIGRVDEQLASAPLRGIHDQPTGPCADVPGVPTAQYLIVLPAGSTQATAYSVGCATDAPAPPRITFSELASQEGQPYTVPSRTGGGHWRILARSDPNGNVVINALSLADVEHTVSRLRAIDFAVGGGALLLLGSAGWVLIRVSLRPLVSIEETAAAIAAGDLSRRVEVGHPTTEVGRLSIALNGMLAQIEAAFRAREASETEARHAADKMRQFIADASHELRTPLTSIRGFAELFRQGAVESPENLERLMRRIEQEASRMGLLVEDLLLLARLDQQRPLEKSPVDLLVLASDAVHDARATQPDRPIGLQLETDVLPIMTGDEPRLRQVLANLVSNALQHTSERTPVVLGLRTRSDAEGNAWADLSVSDQGPGLSPVDAERIFERFYRVDKSRTRDNGGTGLGLSIVAALVAAHGGNVDVLTAPGDGTTFTVHLPLNRATIQ